MKLCRSMDIAHEQTSRARRFRALRLPGFGALAIAFALAALAPTQALAQEDPTIQVELVVTIASDEPGPIDARAKKIDAQLRRDFRYQSLKVVDSKTQRLGIDDTATIKLPNGKSARVMPMAVDESGVLLAVDIEGAVKVDAKAKSGHMLVFVAGRHAGGRLIVSVEPTF